MDSNHHQVYLFADDGFVVLTGTGDDKFMVKIYVMNSRGNDPNNKHW